MEWQAKYEVHISTSQDAHEGRVWIFTNEPAFRAELDGQRWIVRITHGKQRVYCEALYADENYVREYNATSGLPPVIMGEANSIFINRWYRRALGIEPGSTFQLSIETSRKLLDQFHAIRQHPQVAIRLAAALGVVSVGLGIIGLGLGIIGVQWSPVIGGCLAVAGALVSGVGIWSLRR